MRIIGTFEIAQLLEVKPSTVHMWRRRDYLNFPQPLVTLKVGPIWNAAVVMEWARKTGRA